MFVSLFFFRLRISHTDRKKTKIRIGNTILVFVEIEAATAERATKGRDGRSGRAKDRDGNKIGKMDCVRQGIWTCKQAKRANISIGFSIRCFVCVKLHLCHRTK